jgi:hypothetical protein
MLGGDGEQRRGQALFGESAHDDVIQAPAPHFAGGG